MKKLILALTIALALECPLLARADDDPDRNVLLTTLARRESLVISTHPYPWQSFVHDPFLQSDRRPNSAIYFQHGYPVDSRADLDLTQPFCKLAFANASGIGADERLSLFADFGVGHVESRFVAPPGGGSQPWLETELRFDPNATSVRNTHTYDLNTRSEPLNSAFYSLDCKAPSGLTPESLSAITGLLVYARRPLVPNRLISAPQESDAGLEPRQVPPSEIGPIGDEPARFVTLAPSRAAH